MAFLLYSAEYIVVGWVSFQANRGSFNIGVVDDDVYVINTKRRFLNRLLFSVFLFALSSSKRIEIIGYVSLNVLQKSRYLFVSLVFVKEV